MKKLKILATLSTIILLASCSAERQLANIQVKKPELLLKYCIDTYKPKEKVVIKDSIIIEEGETIFVPCDSIDTVVVVKVPPKKTVFRDKYVEVEDTRKLELMKIEMDKRINQYTETISTLERDLLRSKDKLQRRNKQLTWVSSALGLVALLVVLRIYLKAKSFRI